MYYILFFYYIILLNKLLLVNVFTASLVFVRQLLPVLDLRSFKRFKSHFAVTISK